MEGNVRDVKINTTRLRETIMQNNDFKLAFAVLFSFVSLITFSGGLFVCHVVCKHRLMKNTVWVLLLLLTVSDTLNAIITIPTYIVAYIDDNMLQTPWMCNFSTFVSIFFALTTIYAIAAISVCRMKVMSDPYCSLDGIQHKSVAIYVSFAVLVSGSLSIPPILGFGEYGYQRGKSWCTFRSNNEEVHNQNMFMISSICLFGYIIPAFIIVFSCTKTFLIFRNTSAIRCRLRGSSATDIYLENWRMAKLMMVIIVAFLIFWTPIVVYLTSILFSVEHGGQFWPLWGHIAHLVMFLQGFINPFVYTCKHKSFSEEMEILFHMCYHQKEQPFIESASIQVHSFGGATVKKSHPPKNLSELHLMEIWHAQT